MSLVEDELAVSSNSNISCMCEQGVVLCEKDARGLRQAKRACCDEKVH